METRNVVLALIGILILLVTLLVGLLSGCLMGGLICGCCALTAGESRTGMYLPQQPTPYRVEPTPVPPVRPTPWMPDAGRVGALITEVMPDSPAAAAGLRPGDLILSVDRQRLGPEQDLKQIIHQHRPGDEVTLGLWRGGRTKSVRVRLTEHPEERGQAYLGIYYRMVGGAQLQAPSVDD